MKFAYLIHAYHPDGIADYRGEDRCAQCGLPKSHKTHDLQPRDPEEIEIEHRVLGEHTEEE